MTRPLVLFAPEAWGYAETARLVAIARRGADAGHFTAAFADHGGPWGKLVEDAGLPRHVLPPTMSSRRIARARAADEARGSGALSGVSSEAASSARSRISSGASADAWSGASPNVLFDAAEIWARVGSETALIETLRPAAIVHGFSLGFALSARACRVPLVAVRPAAGTRWPYRAGLARWTDARSTLPWRLVPVRLRDAGRNRAAVRSRRFAAPFAAAARSLGLPPPRTLWDLVEGDVTLIADVAAGAGLGTLPDHVRPIGAIDVGTMAATAPRHRPAAYVDVGGAVPDVARVAGVLTARGWSVVAAPGDDRFRGTAVPVTPASLGRFDVAILCGDPKCVVPAALAGVPIVGVGANGGEEAALDRLACVGIARRLERRQATAERIADLCDRARSDPAWRTNSALVAAAEGRRDGAGEAAGIIGRFR